MTCTKCLGSGLMGATDNDGHGMFPEAEPCGCVDGNEPCRMMCGRAATLVCGELLCAECHGGTSCEDCVCECQYEPGSHCKRPATVVEFEPFTPVSFTFRRCDEHAGGYPRHTTATTEFRASRGLS